MNEILNEAIKFATDAHGEQLRKISLTPYILHPLEVAAIISTITNDREIMAAGVLHDTIEDCGVNPKVIKERFGARVSALVQSETEDKMSYRPANETWMERKEDSLLMLENTKDEAVKILWLGDKLSNMRAFYRAWLVNGDKIWLELNQKDPKMHAWYYRSIAKSIASLKDTAAYKEYVELVEKVFGKENDNG